MNIEMRRKDRALEEAEAMQLLKGCEYGVLSLISPDDTPYGVPISYVVVENAIYMHCAKAEGHKLQSVKHCGQASLTVVDHVELLSEQFSTRYMSAIAFGTIGVIETEEEKRVALNAIIEKYSPDFLEKGHKYIDSAIGNVCVLKLEIEKISGKGRKN